MTDQKNTTALAVRGEPSTALAAQPAGFVRLESITEAINFAQFIAKSDLVPKAYQGKPADIVIAMQMGMELGFSPLQALQTVAVINGKPGIYGDGIPALIIGHPECEDIHEQEPEGDDPTKWVATCTIVRRGKSPIVRRFSYDDAKKAGLWGKSGPWSQYPKRMLQMRARGFAARDAFPDVLKGIITIEEAQDYPAPAPVIAEPRRLVLATPAVSAPAQTSAVPPAETDPADDAAATPAAPAASSQASSPAAASAPSPTAPADQTLAGVAVVNSSFSRDKQGQALYEVQTSEGMFYTRDQELFSALAVIEGTDHTASLTFRLARKGGQTARVLTAVHVDEVETDEEGAQA